MALIPLDYLLNPEDHQYNKLDHYELEWTKSSWAISEGLLMSYSNPSSQAQNSFALSPGDTFLYFLASGNILNFDC
jgi:hypothetical protein